MLPKENRLKNKKDFEKVFKKGKGCGEDFLYVKFLGNSLKDSRFGFIASTKFSKKAVERNKIKRALREAIKKRLNLIKKGIDVIIIASPGLKKSKEEVLDKKIEKIFKKIKII